MIEKVNFVRLKYQLLSLAWVFFIVTGNYAQQPFITDDTDVTGEGEFHLEVINEASRLQPSAFPVKYQNGARITAAYGAVKNVEVSVSTIVLTLVSDRSSNPRFVTGLGDTTFAVKYNLLAERKDSRLPALAVSSYLQVPTGDANRSLGSGVTDFGFYGAAQKTLREKNVLRVNLGYVVAGNTVTGVLGISKIRGGVLTGGASYVRKISEKLQLGGEITGAVTKKNQLSRGQLQTQFGGNYQINEKTTFDFGFIVGRSAASPRYGFQVGFARDF